MPRGDKDAYTDKQKRKAQHIAEGYEERGMGEDRAEQIAWATVNKEDGGGTPDTHESAKRGGERGGKAGTGRSAAEKSAAAKKGWETRRRNGNG